MSTEALPLEALEHALITAKTQAAKNLVDHSDRGSQYVSLRYTERLTARVIKTSIGSQGLFLRQRDGRDRQRPIRNRADRQQADLTINCSSRVRNHVLGPLWWNHQRLHESLDYQTPAEIEHAYTKTSNLTLAGPPT